MILVTGLGAYFFWKPTVVVGSVLFSIFYLAVVLFRSMVLADFEYPNRAQLILNPETTNAQYVILIALYKEAGQIADLVTAIDKLRWGAGNKTVFLICEADDYETISVIEQTALPSGFKLLIVPNGSPRTKPRALNFGLAQVTGDYLVIYDAEDRPHRDQLLEAASLFSNSPKELVCLQAPLKIDNVKESFLTRLFSIEYDTLFLGILPSLTKWKSPMPLGGTSNHFRMDALKQVGGWDSYNVTEDADLGIRLARFGFHSGVIQSPTLEEAPARTISWLTQRTRWIKGWMQTLLVHMRHPIRTANQMRWDGFFKFHMVLTSVVVSVLVHPFFLVAFAYQIISYFSGTTLNQYDIWITAISAFNLVAGYSTYGMLAYAVQSAKPKTQSKLWILLLPFYWVLISIAGWRALLQIIVAPHHWEKTPHQSTKRRPDLI